MDCKKALQETQGDLEAAVTFIAAAKGEAGKAAAAKASADLFLRRRP